MNIRCGLSKTRRNVEGTKPHTIIVHTSSFNTNSFTHLTVYRPPKGDQHHRIEGTIETLRQLHYNPAFQFLSSLLMFLVVDQQEIERILKRRSSRTRQGEPARGGPLYLVYPVHANLFACLFDYSVVQVRQINDLSFGPSKG